MVGYQPTVSVIVPIYNAEQYLKKTIELLINQTFFKRMQVVLINDGSVDGSLSICEDAAIRYNNIDIINQKNAGVSSARNAGLKVAKGKYIVFLDADDTFELNYIEKLYNLVRETNADIAIVDFDMIHSDGIPQKHRSSFYKEWLNSEDALKGFFAGEIGNNLFDKIYKFDVIQRNFFSEEYRIGEDMFFTYRALLNVSKVVINTGICGYHYWIRDNSAMNGTFNRKYFDAIKLSEMMCEECSSNESLKDYAKAHYIHEVCKLLEYIYRRNADKLYMTEILGLREQLSSYNILDAERFLVKKQFFGFLLMRISPRLYLIAHKIMRIG